MTYQIYNLGKQVTNTCEHTHIHKYSPLNPPNVKAKTRGMKFAKRCIMTEVHCLLDAALVALGP